MCMIAGTLVSFPFPLRSDGPDLPSIYLNRARVKIVSYALEAGTVTGVASDRFIAVEFVPR